MFENDSNRKCTETWNITFKACIIMGMFILTALLLSYEFEEKLEKAAEIELMKPVK